MSQQCQGDSMSQLSSPCSGDAIHAYDQHEAATTASDASGEVVTPQQAAAQAEARRTNTPANALEAETYRPLRFKHSNGCRTWADPRRLGFGDGGVSVHEDAQTFVVNLPSHMFEAAPTSMSSIKAGAAYEHNAMTSLHRFYSATATLLSLLVDVERRPIWKVAPAEPKYSDPSNAAEQEREEMAEEQATGGTEETEQGGAAARKKAKHREKEEKDEKERKRPTVAPSTYAFRAHTHADANKLHWKLDRYHFVVEMVQSRDGSRVLGARVWKLINPWAPHEETKGWGYAMEDNRNARRDNGDTRDERCKKSSASFLSDAVSTVSSLSRCVTCTGELADKFAAYDPRLLPSVTETEDGEPRREQVLQEFKYTPRDPLRSHILAPERVLNPLFDPTPENAADDGQAPSEFALLAGLVDEELVPFDRAEIHPAQVDIDQYFYLDRTNRRKFVLPRAVLENGWAHVLNPDADLFAAPLPPSCGLGGMDIPECIVRAFVEVVEWKRLGSADALAHEHAADTVPMEHATAAARRACENHFHGRSEGLDVCDQLENHARMYTFGTSNSKVAAAVQVVHNGPGLLGKAQKGAFSRQRVRDHIARPSNLIREWKLLMKEAYGHDGLCEIVCTAWRADQLSGGYGLCSPAVDLDSLCESLPEFVHRELHRLHDAAAMYAISVAADLIERRGGDTASCLPPGMLHAIDAGRGLLDGGRVDPSGLLPTHGACLGKEGELTDRDAPNAVFAVLQRQHAYVLDVCNIQGPDATPAMVVFNVHALGASSIHAGGICMLYGIAMAAKSKIVEAGSLLYPQGFVIPAGSESRQQGKHDAPMNGFVMKYDEFPAQLLDTPNNAATRDEWKEQATNGSISHSTVAPKDPAVVRQQGGSLGHTDKLVCCERTEAKIICANKNPSLVTHVSSGGFGGRSADSESTTEALASRFDCVCIRPYNTSRPARDCVTEIEETAGGTKLVLDFQVAHLWKTMLVLLGDLYPASFKPDLRLATQLMRQMDKAASGSSTGFYFKEPSARTIQMRREKALWMMMVDVAVHMLTQEQAYLGVLAPPLATRRGLRFDMSHLAYLRKLIAVPPPQLIVFVWAMSFRNTLFAQEHATTLALARIYNVGVERFMQRVLQDTLAAATKLQAEEAEEAEEAVEADEVEEAEWRAARLQEAHARALEGTRALMAHRRVARVTDPPTSSEGGTVAQHVARLLPGTWDLELLYARECVGGTGEYSDLLMHAHSQVYPPEHEREYDSSALPTSNGCDYGIGGGQRMVGPDIFGSPMFDANRHAQFMPVTGSGIPCTLHGTVSALHEQGGPGGGNDRVPLSQSNLATPHTRTHSPTHARNRQDRDVSLDNRWLCKAALGGDLKSIADTVRLVDDGVRDQLAPEVVADSVRELMRRRVAIRSIVSSENAVPRMTPATTARQALQRFSTERPHVQTHPLFQEPTATNETHNILKRTVAETLRQVDHVEALYMLASNRMPQKQINIDEPRQLVPVAKYVDMGKACPRALALSVDAAIAAVELECEARCALEMEPGYSGKQRTEVVADARTLTADFYGVLIHASIVVARSCVWNRGGTSDPDYILPFISPNTGTFVTFKIGNSADRLRAKAAADPAAASPDYDTGSGRDPFADFARRVVLQRALAEDSSPEAMQRAVDITMEAGRGALLREGRARMAAAAASGGDTEAVRGRKRRSRTHEVFGDL